MIIKEDDEESSRIIRPQKDYVIIGNNVYERVDKRPEDVLKDILRKNEEAPVGNNMENTPVCNNQERYEDLFHFVHPELDEAEARRIHNAVKRVVKRQGIQMICIYLMQLKGEKKVLLPPNPSVVYIELVRTGMPDGEGFNETTFRKYYNKPIAPNAI
ncbi:MAG: hypothetical protein IKP30_06600 [Bacteroidaceae bacterium]|nr:hypothetical protein [Bacteroidaceae bacterium]